MTSANITHEQGATFNFSTTYRGCPITLTVAPAKERFAVLNEGKLFGYIKIGKERHSWFVADSNYVEYQLVKEIGQRILEVF